MKFRIFIFFVWVSFFSIVSSNRQYHEFEHRYQQHPNRPTHENYAHNTPVLYPSHSQFLNHDEPSHASNHASHSEPPYGSPHQPGTFFEKDPRVYENIAESSAQSQAKSRYEYKPLVHIPQPHQELPRPYPLDKTFELYAPPAEHVYRPDYTHHVAKPWLTQNTYEPTVKQEIYQQPIVYSEQQPSVYQHPPPLQHAQPQHAPSPQQAQLQHPRPAQHPQPQHSPPSQHQPPPQHPKPHQQLPHQQTYYKPQPSYEVPVAHAQAEAYATSETIVADILSKPVSKPEVKDYLESALLKHYQLDDLGNSHHVKSSDDKLEENDNDMERTTDKPHINHQNNRHFKNHFLENDDQVPQKNNYIENPQTVPEETKHETILPKNDDNELFYHPRFAYLNHKKEPTEVKTFPIEVKPVNPHHYANAKHHPNDILVNEQQKPAVPAPLGNTDDSYPIEPRLKDKEITLHDHDLNVHEQLSKKQPEQKPYENRIHPENDYIPTILSSKIPSHSTPIDLKIIENPVDKSVDTSPRGINKPKDSFHDVSPLLFYSDAVDDAKAPLIASPNLDQPNVNPQSQPEVAEPATDTNNGDVGTNAIVTQKENTEKIIVTKVDVDDKKQTTHDKISDNGDRQQNGETVSRSTLPKDIAYQSSIEESPLNADSPTDDETATADENLPNDDCTSGEIDSNNNGHNEEAADSEHDSYAVLLSSIDLWEKLLTKQPNLEFQAFNVVTLSPIVEKKTRLFAFPNGTTVEESVETVWKCKSDTLPSEIKLTTTIKNPSQDKNKCD